MTVLAGEAGGELANVNRWRGQIGLPRSSAALAAREPLKTKAGTVSVYDFKGDGGAVVAGLTFVDGNTWFVKMTGDPGGGSRPARLPPDRGEPPCDASN